MKNGNIVIACVATGIAAVPFGVYQFRTPSLFFDGSLEDWFVSALKGGDGFQTFRWVTLVCAAFGLIVGLLLKRVIQPPKDPRTEPAFLRTPVAVAIFIPFGIATILFVAYNHTAQVFEGVVWPKFYSENWLWCSIAAAVVGYILAALLNTWERAFAQSSFLVKAEIIFCSPLSVCVGVLVMSGLIGSGLLGGFVFGGFYGCPITGAWIGTCIAIAALAIEKGVFWPAYFSLAAPQGSN